jgi:tRNA-specific 2-thiouridylase
MKKGTKTKIVVAMSGGVDSSLAAALLKESQDFEVIGIFMSLWQESISKEAEKRARKVAKFLKIPFYVFDFKKEFKNKIVDCFLKDYKKGITPNPCIICNKKIKFQLLFEKARKLGAEFIATGHYTLIKQEKGRNILIKGKDKAKDQSYFLWKLSQKQLSHILFPVGGYEKKEVKEMAKKMKLPLLDDSESQEICFIKNTTSGFLEKYLKTKKGKIIEASTGKTAGYHEGLWFYTIGQRKGIKLAQGPFYVLDKDLKKNILIVTKNEKDLYKKEAALEDVNWISGEEPKLPLKAKIKIRYGHKAAVAIISKMKDKKYKIEFEKAQKAVTPGQSAVFYSNSEVLGGALITKQ